MKHCQTCHRNWSTSPPHGLCPFCEVEIIEGGYQEHGRELDPIDDELKIVLDAAFSKHEIRVEDARKIVEALSYSIVNARMIEFLRNGDIELFGIEDGNIQWAETDKGKNKLREYFKLPPPTAL